jgi:uncharacterized protein
MLKRIYTNKIDSLIKPNKVLVIYGPRRVGKTTLVEDYLADFQGKVYKSTGENSILRDVLNSQDFTKITAFFSSYDLIFIDEAQHIENIGLALKIIVDQIPGIRVIATGSSSFDLSNKIGEPLVGRSKIIYLYPFAISELIQNSGVGYIQERLDSLLIYGSYPDIVNSNAKDDKIDFLATIRDAYLYKDILTLDNVKNSKVLHDLLRLVAFQIGQEVSLQELGSQLGISKNSVSRYMDLLEKAFVIINIRGFSRNLRKEITKTSRYYFYDNGIRNAIINNYNDVDSRDDMGKLWENFLVIERIKQQKYQNIHSNNYFWRTWDQQEIDWLEERDGKLFGYEFKYSPNKKVTVPKSFKQNYPESEFQVITKENYLQWLL